MTTPTPRSGQNAATQYIPKPGAVATVLGPVAASELGVIAVHEALLHVLPGADLDPLIPFDRAEAFEKIAAKLTAFKEAGGGTIVDATGTDEGRRVTFLESLARATGVHIVASTGMGPEELLGGYFLTPQLNPPTPWSAEKFADLFTAEVTQGMVVPRIERRGHAGLVTTTMTRGGLAPTDDALLRGAARAARTTGTPMSLRWGADPLAELDMALSEGLDASRILIADLDRSDVDRATVRAIAERGAWVGLDHVGTETGGYITDEARAALVLELAHERLLGRVLISTGANGYAVGVPAVDTPYEQVLTSFLPALIEQGASEQDARSLVTSNPQAFLAATEPHQN